MASSPIIPVAGYLFCANCKHYTAASGDTPALCDNTRWTQVDLVLGTTPKLEAASLRADVNRCGPSAVGYETP